MGNMFTAFNLLQEKMEAGETSRIKRTAERPGDWGRAFRMKAHRRDNSRVPTRTFSVPGFFFYALAPPCRRVRTKEV